MPYNLHVTKNFINSLILKSHNRILDFIQSSGNRKARHELMYWKIRKGDENVFSHSHYLYFYTNHFGLDKTFFNGKKILDLGCGPRGSLEWAEMASKRVGLDPLAASYRRFGTERHKMQYVAAHSEQLPLLDEYFDVVCSFNSLDHVDNIEQTIKEIARVIVPGGLFLLLTEVNHAPTVCEPQAFSWDIVKKFLPILKLLDEKHYEKSQDGIYQSILTEVLYNHNNRSKRYGILSAKFIKHTRIPPE